MKRINTGWRMAKDSFRVIKADRSLVAFPAISTLCVVVALALTLTPGLIWSEAVDKDWIVLPFLAVGGYVATYSVVYFNVALAGATRLSMDGKDTQLADGLAVARERRGLIRQWATIQFLIGVIVSVIHYLANDSSGGKVATGVTSVANAAWSVSTFFVIPLLALEGLSPSEAFKRSTQLVRERWGEGLVGSAAVGLAVLLGALLPVFVLINAGNELMDVSIVLGAVVFFAGLIGAVGACVLGSALGVVFRVELYRYSTEGEITGGFAQEDMVAAFQPPKAAAP